MSNAIFRTDLLDAPQTTVRLDPFPFISASGLVDEGAREAIARDFPKFPEPGYLPYNKEECGPSVNRLIEEATSPAIADRLGNMLGIEHLSGYPTLVTICTTLNKRHGTIHTDSRSKIATVLIYLNDTWDNTSNGCLRFLGSNDDIDNMIAPELPPTYGNFAMFKRTENSFHGHLPYEGERRVVQIAWITSQDELDRKNRRGRFSRFLKSMFGGLDKKIGANRDRNASHLK